MINNDLIFGKNNLGNSEKIVLPVHNGMVVEPSEYLKWLDYANRTDLYLTNGERDLLRKEYEVKKIIEKYTRKEMLSEEEKNLMESYMRMFSIPKLAELKLTKEDISRCESRVETICGNILGSSDDMERELQKSIEMFKASSSVTDGYVSYILRMKLSQIMTYRNIIGVSGHALVRKK